MQDPNVARTMRNDSFNEHATTIPPAPSVVYPPAPPSNEPAAQSFVTPPPAYSSGQRSASFSRRFMRRLLYAGGVTGRALRPYALTLVVSAIFLAVIGWLGMLLVARSIAQPSYAQVEAIPPAESVQNFLRGQQNYDGAMMWDSLSEQVKAQLLQRGDSKLTWQAQADMNKRAGQKYRSINYIGGMRLPSGGSMYFYMVDVESPRPDRGGPTSFVFTVDQQGKIVNVE